MRSFKKTGMFGEKSIQRAQFGEQVILTSPGKARFAMDINFFGCQPFDAAGETEATAHAGQSAQPVPQQRPRATARSQPLVIVGFAVMQQQAGALCGV